MLFQYKADLIIISLKINMISLKYCWVGIKQQSLTHYFINANGDFSRITYFYNPSIKNLL